MGYPKEHEHRVFGPFLPPLPTPKCDCGLEAYVKQSRHAESAARAFYVCKLRRRRTLDSYLGGCNFFQWIDGHEKFNPLIRLFPYDPWKSCSYSEFVRWLPPPPNPPEMTEEEKIHASFHRLSNPPYWHCGISADLQNPSRRDLFTPFFRCRLKDARGFPSCDFEEYIHGPKAHWPSEYDFQCFEAGIKEWPCTKLPDVKCKCGIKAKEGVVPSELGFGYYCGNAYGGPCEFWEGRTCDWEDFPDRGSLLASLRIRSPFEKDTKLMIKEEKQKEVRKKYNVPTPSHSTRLRIADDYKRTTGKSISFMHGEMTVLNFWRQNKERYAWLEKEAAREKAYFESRRAEQAARASRLGSLKRRLFDDVPNDGHLPAPKDNHDDDDDDQYEEEVEEWVDYDDDDDFGTPNLTAHSPRTP